MGRMPLTLTAARSRLVVEGLRETSKGRWSKGYRPFTFFQTHFTAVSHSRVHTKMVPTVGHDRKCVTIRVWSIARMTAGMSGQSKSTTA